MFSSLFSGDKRTTSTPPGQEAETEHTLMASLEAYFGTPEEAAQAAEEARLRRQAAARALPPSTSEQAELAYRRQLKPLFKEWLEIRYDLDQARGPYRKLMNSSSASSGETLSERTSKLKEYLGRLEEGTPTLQTNQREVHHLKLFTVWLRKQVDALVVTLTKAMAVEGTVGAQGGGGGGGGPQRTSPSSAFSPQLSPFSPSTASSNSPTSN